MCFLCRARGYCAFPQTMAMAEKRKNWKPTSHFSLSDKNLYFLLEIKIKSYAGLDTDSVSVGRLATAVVLSLPCPDHFISVSCRCLYVTLIVSASVLWARVYGNETCRMRPERTHVRTFTKWINPYPTAFPYGNGMVLHFYKQQESSTTITVHKVINKGLKTYV